MADFVGPGHGDFAKHDRDAEPDGAIGAPTPINSRTTSAKVSARVRVPHHVDGEQRRLGLDVVDVRRIAGPRVGHRRADAVRDVLHHRGPTDVSGRMGELIAVPWRDALRPPARSLLLLAKTVACEVSTPSQPPGPDHEDPGDVGFAARSVLEEGGAEGAVRQDPGEVMVPPLPSVLPVTATTESIAMRPDAMNSSAPRRPRPT